VHDHVGDRTRALPECRQALPRRLPAGAGDADRGALDRIEELRSRLRSKGLSLRSLLRGPGPTEAVVSMLGKEAAAWA